MEGDLLSCRRHRGRPPTALSQSQRERDARYLTCSHTLYLTGEGAYMILSLMNLLLQEY